MKQEETITNEYLKGIVLNLPDSPGIYQYLNAEGVIIYVGKAKNLKRRVSSYFNREHPNGKTRLLVSKIADIRYIVVKSEEDALLLENNLIKKYKPRYNVLLKDDKTYPSICVSNEYFPRVFKTRNIIRNGSSYYGPYSHIPSMNALLELIKKLYPLRTCHHALTPENIRNGKFNVCLEYHIKNCKGPCIGMQSHENYLRDIDEIKQILKGDTQIVCDLLMDEMKALAMDMRFEEAQAIKEKYELIESYRSKSEVVNRIIHNVDVFSIEMDESSAYINYLHITNGCINQAFTFEYKKRLNESKEELLQLGIVEMRERYQSKSREIIVPFELDMEMNNVTFTIPQRGEKKHLLELSIMNVKQYKVDRLKQADKLNPEQKKTRILKEIQEQLHLPKIPVHIECFDNSNIQGSDAVAACVVFRGGKPSTKEYRHFNIKTVEGPDDYASMKEIINRRYSRLIKEEKPLPDLIIIDGGKGQLAVAVEALSELGLYPQIPIISIAERLEEIYYPGNPYPLCLDKRSNSLKTIQHIRDEAHRFGITHHRNKRSKETFHTMLTQIPGIGEKTAIDLLLRFKSVKQLKETPLEEIEKCIGKAKAQKLFTHLQK